MPQADDGLRARMIERFGGISDEGPTKFLTDAGYALTRDFEWAPKPGVTSLGGMTRDEFECLLFMMDEWDYGSLATPPRASDAAGDGGV